MSINAYPVIDIKMGKVSFKPYEKHEIDQQLCTKCDNCRVVCRDNAVEIVNINAKDQNQ